MTRTAADQANRYDAPADRDQAVYALLDWYAHTARTCDVLLFPAHPRLQLHARQPLHPTPIADRDNALVWLDVERDNLLAALHHSSTRGLHQHTVLLAYASRFLFTDGALNSALGATVAGLVAARQCGDRVAQAAFHMRQGGLLATLERWDQARAELDQARALAVELGDRPQNALAINDIGWLCIQQERFAEAVAALRQALPLSRGIDTGRAEGLVEGNLCRAYTGLGEYQEALVHGERSLSLRRQCGDLPGEANALHHLAQARQRQGEYQLAIALCREAVALGRRARIDLGSSVAGPLDTLAQCLHTIGKTAAAIASWREAASLYETHGRPHRADCIRERLETLGVTLGS